MVYLLKDLKFKKYLFKVNKEKSISNPSLFTTELKNLYEIRNKKLLENFKKNINGLKLVNRRSILLDEIIYKCYKQNVKYFKKNIKNFKFSIIATGGFGRKELAPHSDIDILFLHSLKNKKNLKNFVKPILHTLWNLGLRVGYATRTPHECILYSKKEIDVCTSILESRFIVGNKNIYKSLMKQYKNKIVERYGKKLLKKYNISNIVVTRAEKGISLLNKKIFVHSPTSNQNVYDVSGAGDTVIATIAYCLGQGIDIE